LAGFRSRSSAALCRPALELEAPSTDFGTPPCVAGTADAVESERVVKPAPFPSPSSSALSDCVKRRRPYTSRTPASVSSPWCRSNGSPRSKYPPPRPRPWIARTCIRKTRSIGFRRLHFWQCDKSDATELPQVQSQEGPQSRFSLAWCEFKTTGVGGPRSQDIAWLKSCCLFRLDN